MRGGAWIHNSRNMIRHSEEEEMRENAFPMRKGKMDIWRKNSLMKGKHKRYKN